MILFILTTWTTLTEIEATQPFANKTASAAVGLDPRLSKNSIETKYSGTRTLQLSKLPLENFKSNKTYLDIVVITIYVSWQA